MVYRNKKILRREATALLIIDIQGRILNVMHKSEDLIANTLKLIKGFKRLNIPLYYTEQYPKGLGETAGALKDELDNNAIHKMSFSCSGAGYLFDELKKKEIKQVAVCGVESHVCVQQTVLDLLVNDFQVDVAADAVSSRKVFDYEIALNRMRDNGAEITSSEAILFELLEVCRTDEFKAISQLVK